MQRTLIEAVPASRLLRDRRRCRSCVYQLLDGRINPKIEALEGACSKQHQITRFAKHDIVRRSFARDVDKGKPGPSREDAPIRLPKVPLRISFDTERLEHFR